MYLGDDMTLGTLKNAKSERYLIAIGVGNTNAVLTLLNFLVVWPAFGVRHCGMDADIRSSAARSEHGAFHLEASSDFIVETARF